MEKEISTMEMAEYVIERMKEMKVNKGVFLSSGTTKYLEKTYHYLKCHKNVTEAQLIKDLDYEYKK